MANIEDLTVFAVNKNPTEFQNTFNELVSERIANRLEARKIEIAQNLYSEDVDQIDEDRVEDVKTIIGDKIKKEADHAVLAHHGFTQDSSGHWIRKRGRTLEKIYPHTANYTHSKQYRHVIFKNGKQVADHNISSWGGLDNGHAANLHYHLKEDVDQIDELSKDTLKSYVKNASADSKFWDKEATGKNGPITSAEQKRAVNKSINRTKGINTAVKKFQMKNEDVNQIDELSGSKLGDYAAKATSDFHKKSEDGDYKGAQKRFLGVHKAKKKFADKLEKKYPFLKKEEVEEQE